MSPLFLLLREFPSQEIRDYVLINNLELVDTPTLHEIVSLKLILMT